MPLVEVREGVILQSQGLKLFGVLHRPVISKPVPGILICHGYAGTKVGRYRMYVRLSEALAKAGIASLRIDFRGCGDSEGSFSDATFEGQVADAHLALKNLLANEGILSDRVGLLGRSMGGLVAIAVARRYGNIKSLGLWCPVFSARPWQREWDEARALASQDPSANPIMFFQGHPASPQLFQQLFKLEVEKDLRALDDIPMLHIHSESDEVVTIDHADQYQQSRAGASARSYFVRLKDSKHEFSVPAEQEYTIQETVRWFQETL